MDNQLVTPPQLSLYLTTFTDGPQHDWPATLELARAMDAAGIDRVVVSDHVVFGENLDAYADPSKGGQVGGRRPTGPDGAATMAAAPALVDAGVTDIRVSVGIPGGYERAVDFLTPLVDAFRDVTR